MTTETDGVLAFLAMQLDLEVERHKREMREYHARVRAQALFRRVSGFVCLSSIEKVEPAPTAPRPQGWCWKRGEVIEARACEDLAEGQLCVVEMAFNRHTQL